MSALAKEALAKLLQSKRATEPGLKSLRIGLLGLGNVGQAVARQIERTRRLFNERGFQPVIVAALVRDARRPRELSTELRCIRLTDDPADLFKERVDVVIELLGGIEPASSLVGEFLKRGIHVVTANKTLLAHRGEALHTIAEFSGTTLRCEASAVAGVPFLNSLRERPLIARVEQLTGILNGTSNFVLTRIERDRCTLREALRRAVQLGFAEPDPTADLSGRDAAEKLVVLLQHLGIQGPSPSQISTTGIDALHPDDLAQARIFGGTIKPVVHAAIGQDAIDAFAGPCWLPENHPLASVSEQQNAVALSGPAIGELVYSGPGAGPDITAATVLDDVISAARESRVVEVRWSKRTVRSPQTAWFISARQTRGRARIERFARHLQQHGLAVRGLLGLRQSEDADRLYAIIEPCGERDVQAALRAFEAAKGAQCSAIRAL